MPTFTAYTKAQTDTLRAADAARRHSNTLVYLGDSITNFNAIVADSATSTHQNSRGFGHWLQVFSRQAFHVVGCFGYSGYTVAQIRAQLPNALAANPRYLFLLAGVNSVGVNASADSITEDFQAIYDACTAAGVTVIHGTMWPAGTQVATPAQLAVVDAVNAWIVQQGAITPGVIVVPWHVAMIDPATGGARDNYCEDGTHPSSLGAAVMGRYAWNVLQPLVGISGSESLAYYNGDTSNLVTNGMFTGSGFNGVPGVSDDWLVTTSGNAAATFSKVTGADGLGDWQQIQITAGGSGPGDYVDLWTFAPWAGANIPASGGPVNQGDTVFGQIEFQTDADFANASQLQLHVSTADTTYQAVALQSGDSTDRYRLGGIAGIIRTPPVLVGAAQLQMHLRVGGLTGGSSATIRVRRASIKRLVMADGLA